MKVVLCTFAIKGYDRIQKSIKEFKIIYGNICLKFRCLFLKPSKKLEVKTDGIFYNKEKK